MNNTRLNLDAFKAKAESINENEVLEKIQGGSMMADCHGFWGAFRKGMEDTWGPGGTGDPGMIPR